MNKSYNIEDIIDVDMETSDNNESFFDIIKIYIETLHEIKFIKNEINSLLISKKIRNKTNVFSYISNNICQIVDFNKNRNSITIDEMKDRLNIQLDQLINEENISRNFIVELYNINKPSIVDYGKSGSGEASLALAMSL